MGDALIIRSGGGYSGGGYIPVTEVFTNNSVFTVPEAKGQQFSVRIFGGGGGAVGKFAGGGGNMNFAVLTLNHKETIQITIGDGGVFISKANNNAIINGGTTAFGTYLSATGGEAGSRNGGGNGGTGGGGSFNSYGGTVNGQATPGGHGTYGGGGGAAARYWWSYNLQNDRFTNNCIGGNGGTYGGGGGGYISGISTGGYGNGGNYYNSSENGLNTIGKVLEYEGFGYGGGANDYKWEKINSSYDRYVWYGTNRTNCLGGGGGYGGNGGNSAIENISGNTVFEFAGGGGGGYGARGGDAGRMCGGGGGGYGHNGGDGELNMTGFISTGGYGGGYGPSGYGHGYGSNGGNDRINAMPGICIVSYMQKIQS